MRTAGSGGGDSNVFEFEADAAGSGTGVAPIFTQPRDDGGRWCDGEVSRDHCGVGYECFRDLPELAGWRFSAPLFWSCNRKRCRIATFLPATPTGSTTPDHGCLFRRRAAGAGFGACDSAGSSAAPDVCQKKARPEGSAGARLPWSYSAGGASALSGCGGSSVPSTVSSNPTHQATSSVCRSGFTIQ